MEEIKQEVVDKYNLKQLVNENIGGRHKTFAEEMVSYF